MSKASFFVAGAAVLLCVGVLTFPSNNSDIGVEITQKDTASFQESTAQKTDTLYVEQSSAVSTETITEEATEPPETETTANIQTTEAPPETAPPVTETTVKEKETTAEQKETTAKQEETTAKREETTQRKEDVSSPPSENVSQTVYTTETGSRYHSTKSCSGLSRAKVIYESTVSDATAMGLTPCKKCY